MDTKVGYIGPNGLNNMASASPTGSVEALTGLPIATGLEVGQQQQFKADEAKLYSYTTPSTAYPWGQLYDGTYMWVQLDPSVTTDPIPIGTCVAWLGTNENGTAPGQVTTLSSTNTDFAGVTIDSNFGKSHPYAFIQLNGKVNVQMDSAATLSHVGDYVSLSTATYGNATSSGAQNTAATALQLGVSLVTSGTGGTGARFNARITRAVARY